MARPCPFLLLLLAFSGRAQPGDNRLTPEEARNGWRLLFDGGSMTNWVDPRQKNPPGDAFTVDDGCLKARAHPHITEDLFTADSFGDFDLLFDWRISPGGNSGVKYRIQDHVFVLEGMMGRFEDMVELSLKKRRTGRPDHGQDYVIGFEYQVIDNTSNRDALRGGKQQAAALYDMVAPSRDVTRPVGEWNHARLVVRGKHTEHWLNGVKVVDTTLDSPEVFAGIAERWGMSSGVFEMLAKQPRKRCPISLQNHGNDAWFR